MGENYLLSIPPEKSAAIVKGFPMRKLELKHEQAFSLGTLKIIFKADEFKAELPSDEEDQSEVVAYRRLLSFSERIAKEKDMDALLATLLKEITQLTGAEHGFLVLIEDGVAKLKVQESLDSPESIENISPMSDSIVKKVIATKEPVIISDALHDQGG